MHSDAKEHWNKTYSNRGMVAPLDFTKRVLEFAQEGDSILDIGCGDGRDASFFVQNGLHVTAIDFSDKAIKRVNTLNLSIDARVMDTTAMNFPDESFNVVYAHLSLHYFDNQTTDAVFQNIRRILKPRGYFFVRCKSTKDRFYGLGEKIADNVFQTTHIRHFFTEEYMRTCLRDFSVLELRSSSSMYDDGIGHFIDAIAKKE